MRAVKSVDTTPEIIVRHMAHAMGFRYRLYDKALSGTPDLVFPARRKIIFVHGCFWHGHHCKRGARIPKTNKKYWIKKINRNKVRDSHHRKALLSDGWKVLTVWECETRKPALLRITLRRFLWP